MKYRGKQEFYFCKDDYTKEKIEITEGPYKGKSYKAKYQNCLYFATDTREIFMNGKPYDGDIYDTTLNDDLEMPKDMGGIFKGTKVSTLKNRTYNQLFDDILFPTIIPTIEPSNAPIFTLSTVLKEVGSSISSVVKDTFTPNFNKGQIMLNGVSQGDYAGDYNWPNIYESITQSSNLISPETDGNYKLNYNNTTYICKVKYTINAGTNIPKDNKGNTNTEDSRIPAKFDGIGGIIEGKIITSAPVYATTNISNGASIIKQSLRNHTIENNRTYTLTVAAHIQNVTPTIIKVPGVITNYYEYLFGDFIEKKLEDVFTITSETINGIVYKVYTEKDGSGESRQIKFTFDN